MILVFAMKCRIELAGLLLWCFLFRFSLTLADVVLEGTFDFIVVGGGSAGSVVTNRLSANGKYTVLLLEKGGEPNMLTEIPALIPLMYFTENVDRYFMEKQEGLGLGLANQRIPWTRGKGLGGGSLINYMIYTRGHKEDFDRWATDGNPGWSYDDVLPYYKKLEHAKLHHINATNRGTEGEVDSTHVTTRTESARAFVDACQETGMPYLYDYLNGEAYGISYLQVNSRNGRRCHAEKAFLHDIRHRKNLQIITKALVMKVVIDPITKLAQGVLYEKDGITFYAKARREVILSAGSLNSPQILMLSGVGPRAHLEEIGIEVIEDLQVGQTIYDHMGFPAVIGKVKENITSSAAQALDPNSLLRFWEHGEGPLTVPAAVEALGFIQTPVSKDSGIYPDVEVVFMSAGFSFDNGMYMRREWAISDEAYDAIWKPLEGQNIWTGFIMPFRPVSKGYMKLRSVIPSDQPKFYGNYFTDPDREDMRTMIAAIRMVQKIAEAPSMAKYEPEIVLTPAPGCEEHESNSDEFWECQIRHMATSVWHQVASCKMGPKDDPEAVVDNELKVHGIQNLRVADISIIPRPISAHTNVPAMMVGEKAADIILHSHEAHQYWLI